MQFFAVSGCAQQEDMQRATEAGFDGYVHPHHDPEAAILAAQVEHPSEAEICLQD
jgi:hypothetical protein